MMKYYLPFLVLDFLVAFSFYFGWYASAIFNALLCFWWLSFFIVNER